MMGVNHARVLAELPAVEFVAVADLDPARVSRAVRGRTVSGYTDYLTMLRVQRPDLVSIVVPTRLHAEVSHAVIDAGAHLLVEKPLAGTVEEGREIARHASTAGVKLMVGHIERFNPAVQELRRRLQRGELGRVIQVAAQRVGPFPDRVRDVGVVHDLATHDIDVMQFLLGAPVERVYAETEQRLSTQYEDVLNGVLRFAGGAIGTLDVNWLTPRKRRRLSVLGDHGQFMVDYVTQELWRYAVPNTVAAGPPDAFALLPDVTAEKVPVQRHEPLRAEIEAFVDCIVRDLPPPVPAGEALAAMEIADRLVESGIKGAAVSCLVAR
jgi:predicted dehydrogenase